MSEAVKSVNQILATPMAAVDYLDPKKATVRLFLLAAPTFRVHEVVQYISVCRDADLIQRVRGKKLPPADKIPEFAPHVDTLCLVRDDDRKDPALEKQIGRPDAWLAWVYNTNLKSHLEIARMAPDVARQLCTRPAYVIEVGPKPDELGFQLLDKKGKIVENFTLRCSTTADVIALLQGPEILDKLASL